MAIIEVQNVTKTYRPRRRASKLLMGRDGLFRFLRRSEPETFDAVHDVSFSVEPGESLGLIGPNGSGKSTVMKILAGVTTPTRGDVTVQGRVASLLELGAGFHPFLTGRENVYLNAGLLGMRHKQTDKVFDDIVAFSGIGEFIDHPVDTYSSGMYVRIAFSVAVHVNPDVFLVDEVLAVGDEEFQRRCRTRIGELKEQGKTIVFVSHDLGIVNTLCDRVILLNKGKMIVRDTPQRTIDFYLRQVGQEKGIHTFAGDTVDGIFSNGRMALFHDQNEVTAATGITGSASSLGSQHHSSAADWRIVEESETGCLARGEFGRLPVIFWWRIALDGKTFTWTIEIECERDVPIDEFHFQVHLPTSYTQWLYGDLSGEFPDLTPADIAWSVIAAPERTSYEAVGLPAEGAPLPAFFVRMRDADPKFRLAWSNTDYVTGSRALSLICRYPQAARTQPAGRRALATLEIDLGQDTASARQLVQLDRTLPSGDLSARFEQGAIRLAAGGEELTTSLHLYASMLLRHIWHDSTSLQWGPVTIEDGVLRVSGESRRFPLKHHWEVRAEPGGFALQIVLETTQPLEIQEYQTSILLRPEYDEWTTGHESGTFPPIPEDENTWRHVNQAYAPGTTLGASGPGVPTVTVELDPDGPTTRATALNTGFFQNARVLQALCVPESGLLYYDLGRQVYFSGHIRIDRGPAQEG